MVEELLSTIEKNGHKCFAVGGYVRDHLLGLESFDIDIATDATPEEIKDMFKLNSQEMFGCIKFTRQNYQIEITTYRIEKEYINRKPVVMEYSDDILKDLQRRDFTINAICMDKNGKIFDPLDGQKDLQNKVLKVIGSIDEKLRQDPLRILRALRFKITEGFTFESKLKNFIENNIELLNSLSYEKRKVELDKIFAAATSEDIEYLDKIGALSALELKMTNRFIPADVITVWAEFDFPNTYPFKKSVRKEIESIKEIIKEGSIDEMTILKYGLEMSLKAAKVLDQDTDKVMDLFESLPIKNASDLAIPMDKIAEITGSKGEMIGVIKKDLIIKIIRGNLPNRGTEIEKYLIEKWK